MKKKMHDSIEAKSTSLMVLLVSVFLLSALAGVGKSAIGYTQYTGTLDGADWALRIPDPWNGMLVVICRGYSATLPSPSLAMALGSSMLNAGFAVAASNFGAAGYCIQAGVNSTYQLTNYIVDTYHVTGKVFLAGLSMGGAVVLLLGAKYPAIYNGVLDISGTKDLKAQYPISTNKAAIEAETGGTPETVPQAYEDRSPTYHANIMIPVITIHGTNDTTVPLYQAILYQTAVANAGRSNLYRLYNVTGGGHLSADVMAEVPSRFAELVAWSDLLTESKTYGGTGNDNAWGDIVQTSDGGYAISGDTTSFGAGGNDYWLIKTDSSGNVQWNKTYGGAGYESESAMCQTIDGGYAMGGITMSFGAGAMDAWLVKTDAAGNMQWNKTYGGTGLDLGFQVVQTNDGGYAFECVTTSFGAGNNDGWLIKTDSNGNMLWNKTYGAAGDDRPWGMIATSDGGYALGGYTLSFGAGGADYWLIKTDASGNVQWNKTYGGTANDYGYFLIQTSDGGYAMVGYTNSSGASGYDAWLVKTDASGNMLWNKTYGGSAADQGNHVLQTVEGGYVIVGYTDSFGAGGTDFWLIKTDANGNMQWNQTYGGTGNEQGWSLTLTSDGGYAIAGYTTSFGAGGQDFWVVKTDASGVVPEGLTVEVMVLLSTVAVIVGTRYFRKRSKVKDFSQVKL